LPRLRRAADASTIERTEAEAFATFASALRAFAAADYDDEPSHILRYFTSRLSAGADAILSRFLMFSPEPPTPDAATPLLYIGCRRLLRFTFITPLADAAIIAMPLTMKP
jgi:hypothetical protein